MLTVSGQHRGHKSLDISSYTRGVEALDIKEKPATLLIGLHANILSTIKKPSAVGLAVKNLKVAGRASLMVGMSKVCLWRSDFHCSILGANGKGYESKIPQEMTLSRDQG